ncbi:TetR/AcrR family transcriptional regulator [Deinococcus sp. HMF7604]|uniref:TetR/AcrR family transcriptional regulator n=1 Tax=Deinococcus betulae TaxID=2873312 RepID=UPI001CCC4423|nr:TetR/AcrR family transcriptional regulator [Deinococcus betulae]MBZ9749590.1 TetR/AcrR family transcriptional regulator [Deinococcus betulae]
MTVPLPPRRRGRPARGAGLTEDTVLTAALTLLERDRAAFSMRALARTLQVDVMSLYHYFPTKEALLDAAVLTAFAPLEEADPFLEGEPTCAGRLERLAALYLGVVQRYPGLTLEIAAGRVPAAPVVARFDALFAQAVRPLSLTAEETQSAGQMLVDYLHGFMLGGPAAGEAWRFAVRVFAQGLRHWPPDATQDH